jgi:hypothetical protein
LFKPPANPSTTVDLRLAVHAQQALQQDPALARFNLLVRVRNGMATVGGTVPSTEIARQVVKKLEQVKGLFGVRSELRVIAEPPGGEPPVIPILPDPPTQTQSASPNPESGTIGTFTGRPAHEPPPLDKAAPPPPTPEARPLSPGVSLHPPIPVREAQPQNPPPGLSSVIEKLRRADERFRLIEPEVRGGTVILGGSAARGEDAMEFARLVSQVAGAERVVLNVQILPAR